MWDSFSLGGRGGVFPGNFGGGVPSSPPNPDPFSDVPHLFSDLISQCPTGIPSSRYELCKFTFSQENQRRVTRLCMYEK